MYHDFLEEASHHRFKGYLHEKPDLVLLANPGLDFFFDCWAPTVSALRDAGYFTGAWLVYGRGWMWLVAFVPGCGPVTDRWTV